MEILICTHGRVNRQLTYDSLPYDVQKDVKFVIQEREVDAWRLKYPLYERYLVLLPDEVRDLPSTREWIQHNMGPKVCMMDDDLVFSVRRYDEPTKFRPPTEEDMVSMFEEIEYQLDHYAHVGVSHREGANRNIGRYVIINRMMRVLAYRTDIVVKEGVISNRTPDIEDFDVTLQLLRKGYPNCILNNWVHNQGGSDQSGGCSEYRTPQTHDRDVRIFAEHHKDFVSVVKKVTKDKWCADENGERTDVRIAWKKAYASAGELKHV